MVEYFVFVTMVIAVVSVGNIIIDGGVIAVAVDVIVVDDGVIVAEAVEDVVVGNYAIDDEFFLNGFLGFSH